MLQLKFIAGINDRIGGSGNNYSNQSSGNSNTGKTLLYVAGGIAEAFIAWTIISDKEEERETDSDSIEAQLLEPLSDQHGTFISELIHLKEQIPVDVTFNMNSSFLFLMIKN